MNEFVTVMESYNPGKALYVKIFLEANGIVCNIHNEGIACLMDGADVYPIWVQVPRGQFDRAVQLINRWYNSDRSIDEDELTRQALAARDENFDE